MIYEKPLVELGKEFSHSKKDMDFLKIPKVYF